MADCSQFVKRYLQLAPLAIVLITTMAYAPGIADVWIFDDTANLVEPWEGIKDARPSERLRAFTTGNTSGPLGRPVSMFTFALNGVLADELSPVHLKATNLFIHLLVGVLVYLFVREVCAHVAKGRAPPVNVSLAGGFAAAFWLLHPLHVSTVLYSVQRMAQLSALFTLLGLWLYCRYRSRWVSRQPLADEILALVFWLFLFTLLAALSKENGVLLPWLVLLTELVVFRAAINGTVSRRRLIFLWSLFLAPVILVVGWVLSDAAWLSNAYATRDFTLTQRALTQPRVLWEYIFWFLLPDIRELGFYHDNVVLSRSILAPITTASSAIAWLVILVVGAMLLNRVPLLLYGLLFFIVGHSLESSVLPLIMVFEHRNYLPVVGLAAGLGYGLAVLANKLQRRVGYLITVAIIAFMTLQLALRASAWGDPLLLAETMAVNHPDSRLSRNLYANTLLQTRETITTDSDSSRQVRGHYLRLAREEYLEITGRFPGDPGAPAMLYVLDSQYLPVRADATAWLKVVLKRLRSKTLDPIDLGAIRAMLNCQAVAVCKLGDDRLSELITIARSGFIGRSAGYLTVHDFYLKSSAPASLRIEWLLSTPENVKRGYDFRRRLLLDYLADGQPGKALDRVPGLLASDPARKRLKTSAVIAGIGSSAQ